MDDIDGEEIEVERIVKKSRFSKSKQSNMHSISKFVEHFIIYLFYF